MCETVVRPRNSKRKHDFCRIWFDFCVQFFKILSVVAGVRNYMFVSAFRDIEMLAVMLYYITVSKLIRTIEIEDSVSNQISINSIYKELKSKFRH